MADPVLHLVAGPNGAGKTTFYQRVLEPVTHLEFVNAHVIAADRLPDAQAEHGYEAAELAEAERRRRIAARESFVSETVFSHPSKVTLLSDAREASFLVTLHIVLIPEELAVARVSDRVAHGGHTVPEDKIRGRFQRLWTHLAEAIAFVDEAHVYDNTSAARPFRLLASFRDGHLVNAPAWPSWTPDALRDQAPPG